MWANAQRDGRLAQYRWVAWRPLFNAAVWLTPTTRVPCSNAVNIGECKTWTRSEFCTWQNSVTGQQPKMNKWCTRPGDGHRSSKVWLASIERRRCSNAGKTRNSLKLAGVPQTTGPIASASGPKFDHHSIIGSASGFTVNLGSDSLGKSNDFRRV